MEEVKKELTPQEKILAILDQFRSEATQMWPIAQFAITGVKSMILSELNKLEKKDDTD